MRVVFHIVTMLATASQIACFNGSGSDNRGSGLSSSTEVEIRGMDDADKDLEGLEYHLICERNGNAQETIIVKESDTDTPGKPKFESERIAVGDRCALEIHADQREDERGNFSFIGVDLSNNNEPQIGLFYSSNWAEVELNRYRSGDEDKTSYYLIFEITKTYRLSYADAFYIDLLGEFALEQSMSLPASDESIIGELRCNSLANPSGSEIIEASAKVGPGSNESQRVFSFALSEAKMQNTICDEMRVSIDRILVYAGALPRIGDSAVQFAAPVQGQTPQSHANLFFNNGGLGYRLVPKYLFDAAIRCERAGAEGCEAVRLQRAHPVWFAQVKTGSSDVIVTYVNPFDHETSPNEIDVASMQIDLNADTPNRYAVFSLAALDKIRSAEYDPVALAQLISIDALAADIRKSLEIKSLVKVWVHGFKRVSEKALNENAKDAVHWFVHLNASQAGASFDWLVSGTSDNLLTLSADKRSGAFFNTQDYFANGGAYASYALSDGGLAGASCAFDIDGYIDTYSPISDAELQGNISELASCRIDSANVVAPLATATISSVFYLRDWHSYTLSP